MSKNKKILLLTIAAVIFIATVVISSSGCSDDGVLKTPDGLKIEDEILTFNEVDGAESYLISVDGSEYETKSPTFDLFEIFNEYKTYEIKVCALGDLKNTFDSEFSLPISYNVYSEHDLSFSPIQNSDECMVFATDPAKIKGKLIIPEASPDGKKVTMIGFPSMDDYAFCGAVNLTSVLIHDGITIIETRAFKDCTNLKRVRIPEELKKLIKRCLKIPPLPL